MSYTRVIWDFNGTILDDVKLCIKSANYLLKKYKLPIIKNLEHYYKVFGFPVIDYYRRLGFDFEKTDYSAVANEWVDFYLSNVSSAPVRSGVIDAVKKISSMGFKQTILSMTEDSMLKKQLSDLGILNLFDEVCGCDNIYASSKLALAENWRLLHKDEKVLYIGDTLHDAESAKIISADFILISGGHESRTVLEKTGFPIIDRPEMILNFLTE